MDEATLKEKGLDNLGQTSRLITREHFDRVDLEIDIMEKKAESIIQDQLHQREK